MGHDWGAPVAWFLAALLPQRVERLVAISVGHPAAMAHPTLGIFSTGDNYLTEEAMVRSVEHVTGPWRYERLEGVSHWIPTEAADWLNGQLLGFL